MPSAINTTKTSFSREDFAKLIKAALSAQYPNLTEALVDDILVQTMKELHKITLAGGTVTFRPYGKFIQKTRKPRPFKAPTGEWVSKPGKLMMGYSPFSFSKEEVQGSAGEQQQDKR